MSYTIEGYGEVSDNAARFVRTKYGIPNDEILSPYFEKEFNCILDFGNDKEDAWTAPLWIQFETDEDKTLFVLRFAS
jgi:hypothetical protein